MPTLAPERTPPPTWTLPYRHPERTPTTTSPMPTLVPEPKRVAETTTTPVATTPTTPTYTTGSAWLDWLLGIGR